MFSLFSSFVVCFVVVRVPVFLSTMAELHAYMELPYDLRVSGSVGRSTFLATHTHTPSTPSSPAPSTPLRGSKRTPPPGYVAADYLSDMAASSPFRYTTASPQRSQRTQRTPTRAARASPPRDRSGKAAAVHRMRRKIAEERVRRRDNVSSVRASMESRAARLARVKANMAAKERESSASPQRGGGGGRRRRERGGQGARKVGGRGREEGKSPPSAAGHKLAQMRMHHRRLEEGKQSQAATKRAEREALIRTLYKQKRRADIRRRLNTPRSYMEDGIARKTDPIGDELARLAQQMEAADELDDDDGDAPNIAPPPASFKALHFQPDPSGRIVVTPYEDMDDELLDLDNIDSIPDITSYHTGDDLSLLSDDGPEFAESEDVLEFLDDSAEEARSYPAGSGSGSRYVSATEIRRRQGKDVLKGLAGSNWESSWTESIEWLATHYPLPKRLQDMLSASSLVLGLGPDGDALLVDAAHGASRVRAVLAAPQDVDMAHLEAIQSFIENPYYVPFSFQEDVPAAPFLVSLLHALDKFYVPAPRASLPDLAVHALPPDEQALAAAAAADGSDSRTSASIARLISGLEQYEWVCALDPVYKAPYYIHTVSQMASWAPPPKSASVVDLDLHVPRSPGASPPGLPSSPYTLTVNVLEAHALEQVSAFGSCSAFVVLSLDGLEAQGTGTTSVVHDTVDPVYRETFEFGPLHPDSARVLVVSVFQYERDTAPEDSILLFEAEVDLSQTYFGDVLWLANDIANVSGRVAVSCAVQAEENNDDQVKIDDLLLLDDDDDADDGALAGTGELEIGDDELDAVLDDIEIGSDEEGLGDEDLGLDDIVLDDDDEEGGGSGKGKEEVGLEDLLLLDDGAGVLGVDDIETDDIDLGLDDVSLDDDDAAALANEDFGLDDIDLDDDDDDDVGVDAFALSSESAPPAGVSASTTSPGGVVNASQFVLSDD